MIVAPFAAMIVQMAISRTREYSADRRGAEICDNPLWLASALEKIQTYAKQITNDDAERNPATAHMFIINPLNGQKADNLFSTHPATENRVAELMKMEDEFSANNHEEFDNFYSNAHMRDEVASNQPELDHEIDEDEDDFEPQKPKRTDLPSDLPTNLPGPWGRKGAKK